MVLQILSLSYPDIKDNFVLLTHMSTFALFENKIFQ